MKRLKFHRNILLWLCAMAIGLSGCKRTVYPDIDKPDPNRPGVNDIISFDIDLTQFPEYQAGDNIETVILPEKDSVYVNVPWYVSKLLRPSIEISSNATIAPISGSVRDFSQENVVYTVRAANGSKKEWKFAMIWLDQPEPERDPNPRHPLVETEHYKIYKIPTFSNAYIATNDFGTVLTSGASVSSSANGVTWTSNGTTSRIRLFFTVKYHGELQLALRGRSGNTTPNQLNVKVYVNGELANADGVDYDHTYSYNKTNQNTDTVTLHRVILPQVLPGHAGNLVEINMGVTGPMNGSYYFRFPELWISGWATRGKGGYGGTGINYVPAASQHFGRRGPSTHLSPEKPAGDMEYFYSEIFVPDGQDILGSYFMNNGFGQGYAGIQVNSLTDRRVLFSVWNPVPETTPVDPRAAQYAPKLVRVNNQSAYRSRFTYTVFSGEGTGGQSRYNAMWPTGKVLKMLTRVRPHPDQMRFPHSSLYKAWFHNGDEWVFIAEWRRAEISAADNNGIQPSVKWYTGAHHFLENFNTGTGHLTRYATWDNDWYIGADGTFYEATNYTFTNDATASNLERVDYAGGIMPAGGPQAGATFLKIGGYFTDNVPAQSKFTKVAKNNIPVLDFAALNAMGTDDPDEDKALTGSSTSPITPGEKY